MKKTKMIESALALFVILAVILVLSRQIHIGLNNIPDSVTEITEGWYYIEDGGQKYVTLPADITLSSGDSLTLYCDDITATYARQTLTTRGAIYRLIISIGDQILYEYDDASFPRNTQMASRVNCTAVLPDSSLEDTIAFTYTNPSGNVYHIPSVYAGSSDAVALYHCSRAAFTMITVFALTVLGVLSICIYLYLKHMQVEEKRFANIAFFLLFCDCWFLTDSSLAQIIGGSSPVIRYISFYAFMLLAIPMLHFLRNTEDLDHHPVIDAVTWAFYFNAILQSLLNYLLGIPLIDMLFVTHILLFGGIILMMILLIRTYHSSHNEELRTILFSFAVVAGGGAVSLILYWLLKISWYEVCFELGIVIFIILLIRTLIITMVRNLKFRTEAQVYQRLAKEDRLTGMKNRRAFEELMTEVEKNADSYQNLFLVFMDLNRLKNVNDTMGHHTGDEMIIAAARCIEKAFSGMGSCFRIGGDEFCAVLPDTSLNAEQLSDRLDEELRICNCLRSRYHISIARGISNLRDESGNLKTISNWKEEADLAMYTNKGWIRRME